VTSPRANDPGLWHEWERQQTREVVCLVKVCHPTLASAQKACQRALVTYGAEQRPYFCDRCGGWHTTTVRRRRF
jgi:hypothetical protein